MNHGKKLLCGLLGLALCLSVTACGSEPEAPVPTSAPMAAGPAATQPPQPRRAAGNADAVDKEETVYVQAEPDGAARKVTVETQLNYGGNGGEIRDRTNLRDIKNTEGDEEFSLEKDGVLLWEDHGERIRYEGESDESLPVTLRLTYWLDGQQVAPAALAGQSGHVRVRFDYDNHTARTVTVTHADLSDEEDEDPAPPETEEVEVPIPFLAISLAMLPEEVFQNVRVENGRLMSLGDSAVVMGYALPGMAETLDLTATELTEDIDLPSYVEFEADVTDFSLDYTATILSNGLLEDLEPGDLDDLEKLDDGLDKLAEAVEEMGDGARELADGADEFAGYMGQYVGGVAQVKTGADTLSQALSAIREQTAPLREGAVAAAGDLEPLLATLETLLTLGKVSDPALEDTAAALEALIAAIDSLQAQAEALLAYPATVESLTAAAKEALAGAGLDPDAMLEQLEGELTEEQRQQLSQLLAAQLGGAQSAIDEARGYLDQLPALSDDPALAQYAEALTQAAAQLRAQAEQALADVDTLPDSPAAALEELSALLTGVSALCDGVDQLADGAGALAQGVSALGESGAALEEAAGALAEGTAALADGLEEFNEKGVSELTDMAGEDLVTLITQLRALREADLDYDNFGGIAEGRSGSVRFIIETDSIE